jgi:hypothetical protein
MAATSFMTTTYVLAPIYFATHPEYDVEVVLLLFVHLLKYRYSRESMNHDFLTHSRRYLGFNLSDGENEPWLGAAALLAEWLTTTTRKTHWICYL